MDASRRKSRSQSLARSILDMSASRSAGPRPPAAARPRTATIHGSGFRKASFVAHAGQGAPDPLHSILRFHEKQRSFISRQRVEGGVFHRMHAMQYETKRQKLERQLCWTPCELDTPAGSTRSRRQMSPLMRRRTLSPSKPFASPYERATSASLERSVSNTNFTGSCIGRVTIPFDDDGQLPNTRNELPDSTNIMLLYRHLHVPSTRHRMMNARVTLQLWDVGDSMKQVVTRSYRDRRRFGGLKYTAHGAVFSLHDDVAATLFTYAQNKFCEEDPIGALHHAHTHEVETEATLSRGVSFTHASTAGASDDNQTGATSHYKKKKPHSLVFRKRSTKLHGQQENNSPGELSPTSFFRMQSMSDTKESNALAYAQTRSPRKVIRLIRNTSSEFGSTGTPSPPTSTTAV